MSSLRYFNAFPFFVLFLLSVSNCNAQAFLFNRSDIALGTNPGGVATADFNGDGKLDVAVTDSIAQTVTILLGQNNGTFKKYASYSTGFFPGFVATGDFNNDGKTDIAVANWLGSSIGVECVATSTRLGRISFGAYPLFPCYANGVAVAVPIRVIEIVKGRIDACGFLSVYLAREQCDLRCYQTYLPLCGANSRPD